MKALTVWVADENISIVFLNVYSSWLGNCKCTQAQKDGYNVFIHTSLEIAWVSPHQLDTLKNLSSFRVGEFNPLFGFLIGEIDRERGDFRPFEGFAVFIFEVGWGEDDGGGSFAGDTAAVVEAAEVSTTTKKFALRTNP